MRRRAGAAGRGARAVRALGRARDGDRRGHRHAAPARVRRGRARRRHAGGRARGRRAALRPRARGAGRADLPATRPRGSMPERPPGGRACWRCSPRPTSRRSASSSSSTTRSWGRARCGGPESADAAVLVLEPDGGSGALAVSIDGNGRRVACDPYTGAVEAVLECARNLACVGRRAARAHQLPELRQPGEAAHRVAAHARGRGPARRLPRARRAGGGRQRLALQRGRRGADLPDADRRDGRQAAGAGGRCRARGSPRRGTRSRSSGCSSRRSRARSSRSCAGGWRSSLPPLDLPAHADALVRVRAAVRGGELPTRPRRLRGRPGLRARRVLHRGRGWARGSRLDADEAALFGEGPGGVIVAGPRDGDRGARGSDRPRRGRRRHARDRRASSRVPVSDLRAAYEDAIPSAFAA